MRIHVDRDLCEGHGQCEYAAPEIFTINDDGELTVIDETPEEGRRNEVEHATRRCPVRALEIED